MPYVVTNRDEAISDLNIQLTENFIIKSDHYLTTFDPHIESLKVNIVITALIYFGLQ